MPQPPPQLMDELMEEILLRLPTDSPASLVRAGLVCRRWCHLVSNPGFQRRFLEFHRRPPPMLGFLVCYHHLNDDDEVVFYTTRFVPTSGCSSSLHHANLHGLRPCDSRHGRVVLLHTPGGYSSFRIVVWNPITGEQLTVPKPPPPSGWKPYNWTTAVLCAATGTDTCDHLDCHRGPFIVVLIGNSFDHRFSCVYSSETGMWSEPIVAPHCAGPIASSMRSALVGNTLYFVLQYKSILEYNLCTRGTSVINLPRARRNKICEPYGPGPRPRWIKLREPFGPIQLTTMEDGRLGFARVEDFSRLCLWSREVEEPAGWVLSKVIALEKLLPLDGRWVHWRCLVGSMEGVSIVFLAYKDELFTVDLRSGQVTKVYTHQGSCFAKVLVPYVNFCTPVFRTPSTLDGPRTSTSIQ